MWIVYPNLPMPNIRVLKVNYLPPAGIRYLLLLGKVYPTLPNINCKQKQGIVFIEIK